MKDLNPEFYDDLAQELITAIYDKELDEGVIELKANTTDCRQIETLFAFNSVDVTLANGIKSMNYLMLAFENGVRISTNFDGDRLSRIIDSM